MLEVKLDHPNFLLFSFKIQAFYKNISWNNFRHELDLVSRQMMPPLNRNMENDKVNNLIKNFNNAFREMQRNHTQQIKIKDEKPPISGRERHFLKTLKKIVHRSGNRISREDSIL